MTQEDQDALRQKIDLVDLQILELLKQRADLEMQMSKIKEYQPDQVYYRPERAAQIFRELVDKNNNLFLDHKVAGTFRDITVAGLALQQPFSVAYLGPEGTFSEQAARKHFGASETLVAQSSIDDLFKQVVSGNVHFSVVPLQNSIGGIISPTFDSLLSQDINICADIFLRIQHNLARASGNRQLKRIYGHPQSFAQCKNWLASHYPGVRLQEVESSAVAAQMAKNEEDSAAICSQNAIDLYKLVNIHASIEDQPQNTTRFIVICKQQQTEPSGRDKTSLVISVTNSPGSLLNILAPFERYNINLTMIESRPDPSRNWNYLFFIDFEGHQAEPDIQLALEEVRSKSIVMYILGSYPRAFE